jgi:hypothetical protein
MAPTDYFDAHTHKGYLNKALENHRLRVYRSSTLSEKGLKGKVLVKQFRQPLGLQSSNTDDGDLLNQDGCPRSVAECEYCQGQLCV